jgi:hypothetical protein
MKIDILGEIFQEIVSIILQTLEDQASYAK